MAKSAGGGAGSPGDLPQHPLVERLKPDPSQPAKRVVDLIGLPGKSDRPGYQRLYLTTKLDYFAEFLASDMVYSEAVAADQSPLPSQEATRVGVAQDATIHYVWARSPQPVDEFDLDIRLGAAGVGPARPTTAIGVPGTCETCPTQCDTCPGDTCHTCQTQCNQATCHTCQTQCNQPTCHTCQTQCNQPTCAATCVTCQTQCNQATCHTCQTQCNQATCHTCQTQCNQHTCAGTCVTCLHTCATCCGHPNTCV
jgi:hypothetical protein